MRQRVPEPFAVLDNHRPGERRAATCLGCRRAADLDLDELRRRWPSILNTELREWLTCRACGHRGAGVTRYRPAPAPPW